MEGGQLAQHLIAFAEQIADVETVHLKEHIFKCAEIQESPCKLFISCSKDANDIVAVIGGFILLYQTVLYQLPLVFDFIEVLVLCLACSSEAQISLLVFFQPFVDGADNQLHRTRLIVLYVNSPRALGHHFGRKLPVIIRIAHFDSINLPLSLGPDL